MLSFLGKHWKLTNSRVDAGLLEKLLENRGLGNEAVRKVFFEQGLEGLHDPLLLKDMGKAVDRVKRAVEAKEKIMIFGDYDVDGMTGTAILFDFLRSVGADVFYALPDREHDGYGLRDYFMERFAKAGVTLLITVDCGTSNAAEIDLGKRLGIETVVTDHHTLPATLPPAVALVNPHQPECAYPNKGACGSLLAFKLAHALAPHFWEVDRGRQWLFEKMGLAMLGLIADCMPVTGENRVIIKAGLESLRRGSNAGISALLTEAGVDPERLTSGTVGFQIGPRLNAAGRLSKPDHALELLLGDTSKAAVLSELNVRRQALVETHLKEAEALLAERGDCPLIAVWSPAWRAGTLGLIAARLAETYGKPAIAMQEREEELVASCRSVGGFDLTGFLRKTMEGLFTSFGGHAAAGGFTLPKANLAAFLKRLETHGKKATATLPPATLTVECEALPEELSETTVAALERLEPFGPENPVPSLLLSGVTVMSIKPVGKQGEHLQLPLRYGQKTFSAIAFRFGQHLAKIDPARPHDVVCQLERHVWNGRESLQLKVLDMRPSDL